MNIFFIQTMSSWKNDFTNPSLQPYFIHYLKTSASKKSPREGDHIFLM